MSGRGSAQGAQPYQIENECSVSSSLQQRAAAAGPGRRPTRRSRCSRRRTGGPRGSAPSARRSPPARWSGPGRGRVHGRPAGRRWSGASSASASASESAITVVCRSRTVPSGRSAPSCSGTSGSRVAATTGSTRRSRAGSTSCSQPSSSTVSSRPDRPGVVPHRARRRVGLQAEPGDRRRESPGRRRAPPSSRSAVRPGVRADQPAVGGHHVRPRPRSGRPTRAPGCPSPGRPAAGSRRGRPSRSGRRGTPGPVRPGTARAPGRPAPRGAPRRPRWLGSYAMSRIAPRSISRASSRRLHTAQECPPERTETVHPRSAASRTPAITSSSSAASSIAAGNRSGPAGVEDAADAGLFVPGVAAQHSRPASRRAPPAGRHPTTAAPPSTGMFAPLTWDASSRGQEQDRAGRRPPAAPTGPAARGPAMLAAGPSGSCSSGAVLRRLGHRRADRVDPDAVRAALDDQLVGQRQHAALGGAVRVLRHEERAARAGDRGDVHDRSAAAARPGAARPPGSTRKTMSSSCRMVNDQSAKDSSPIGPNRIAEALLTRTSDPPARATRGLDPPPGTVLGGQVDRRDRRPSARLARTSADRLLRRLRVQVAAHHVGALRAQSQRGRPPDPAAGARDERPLAVSRPREPCVLTVR